MERTPAPTTQHHDARHVLELDERECWALLRTCPVGRLAWQTVDGPTVVPVNFHVRDDVITIRTTPYSAAARESDDSLVAFQVDDIDPEHRAGWSVLVRGRAHLTFGHADDADDPEDEPDVWPAGPRALRLRITASSVSGRRLPPA